MKGNIISIKAKDSTYIPTVTHNVGEKSVKGIVIVSHGFGEHSGNYEEFAKQLKQANYACVVFDQRGHGNLSEQSPEKRKKLCGIVPSYKCFLDDIGDVTSAIKQRVPNTPIVLYGHSMGGNIAANYLLKHSQTNYSCAVLEAPWLGLYKEVNPLIVGLAKVLGSMTPRIAIINKLPLSDITSDETKAEEIGNDPLYHNRISLRMFTGIRNGCKYAINNASQLSIPTYLAVAKYDTIVSNQAIGDFYGNTSGHVVTKQEYESRHSIHNDVKKEDFYQDIIAFLDVHCLTVQSV